MTPRAPLLALLGLLLCCGPADDAGSPPPRSTDTPAVETSAPAETPDASPSEAAPAVGEGGTSLSTPERVRAVFLGTSLTAGLGLLRDSERFTDIIQAMADSAGLPLEVVNAGVSGDTSAGGLRRLSWLLAEPLDILVVELGANDGLRGLPVSNMRDNLTAIVRQARSRYPAVRVLLVAMEAPPNMGERYTSEFRDAFRQVADAEGVDLGPFLLEGVAGIPRLNQGDRIHPNPEGHRIVAHNLWPYVERLVEEVEADRGVSLSARGIP